MSNPTTAIGWKNLLSSTGIEGDGNFSIKVGPNRYFWVTGDTLQGYHNTLRIIDDGTITTLSPAITTTDGSFYWLGQMVIQDHTVYMFSPHLAVNGQSIGTDLLNFAFDGTFLGITKTPSSSRVGQNVIAWGAGLISSYNGTYIYGAMNVTGEFGFKLFLAFAPKLNDYTQWTYWNGQTFVSDENQATALSIVNTDGAFQVMRRSNKYIIVTKHDGGWGTEVVKAEAFFPWGPFTTTKLCDSVNDEYLVSTHPQIQLASKKTLVTINKTQTPVRLEEWNI